MTLFEQLMRFKKPEPKAIENHPPVRGKILQHFIDHPETGAKELIEAQICPTSNTARQWLFKLFNEGYLDRYAIRKNPRTGRDVFGYVVKECGK